MCEKPIKINPAKMDSKHMQIIGKCGTYGHKRIIKEMLSSKPEHEVELMKLNCLKTSYGGMIQKHGGELVNPKMGGTTIDPVEEFCKLSEEKKAEFVEGIIKIIERNETEKNKG